jgi:DNA repair photolyase
MNRNNKINIPQIPAKTIVSAYTTDGWFGTNYTMNIYKGCCHGCIYCDSRSECYRIENFDTVRAKMNALDVISYDLRSKRKKGTVITGSMSDPYNPYERECELSRGALKLIDYYKFGICIDTKSDLVVRDIDILQNISDHSSAFVNFTVTTADDDLCLKIEQSVCPTSKRIAAVKKMTAAGITCGILLMPILPYINDTESNIISIVKMAADAGVKWIYAGNDFGVTLRQNQREHYYNKIDELFPGVKIKYIKAYGDRYHCAVPNLRLFDVFVNECRKYNIMYDMHAIIKSVTPPVDEQLSFDI